MISMGKSGGVYGSGNTGLPQAFSGGKKTQNNQKSIFGAKNKSSVTDIRRMLSRNSQSTQTQAANSWGQESIVTSTLSYSESLRNQRQQTKNTTLALKKLKYQFKSISSKILRSKTSQAAKQAAGQARREIMRLKRQKQNSDSDSDSEEIDAAIAHAQAMERVAKKKAKHLEEEEMMKAAGGICQGDRISEEETKDAQDAESENARNAEEMSAESSADEMSRDLSAYEYAGNEVHAGDSYDISDYIDLGIDAFYAQTGDFMSEMSDFTSEMMQEMSDSLRDLMEEMGLEGDGSRRPQDDEDQTPQQRDERHRQGRCGVPESSFQPPGENERQRGHSHRECRSGFLRHDRDFIFRRCCRRRCIGGACAGDQYYIIGWTYKKKFDIPDTVLVRQTQCPGWFYIKTFLIFVKNHVKTFLDFVKNYTKTFLIFVIISARIGFPCRRSSREQRHIPG